MTIIKHMMDISVKFNPNQVVFHAETGEKFIILNSAIEIDNHGNVEITYIVTNIVGRVCGCYPEESLTEEPIDSTVIYYLTNGEEYYKINNNEDISKEIYSGSTADYSAINHGNAFSTLKEAERELIRRNIHQELKRLAKGHNFNPNQKNYYIIYNYLENKLDIGYTNYSYQPGVVYFPSRVEALNALTYLGSEQLKYVYFGVEENDRKD